VFGEMFCIIRGFAAETSTNATVLTITAFTIERYVAICHPFISHTESNLPRAFKYILIIWVIALTLAFPQVNISTYLEIKLMITTELYKLIFTLITFLSSN